MTDAQNKDDAIEYRLATSDDGDGVWAVLEEVAPEIEITAPITPERQRTLRNIIAGCCGSAESWVAVDAGGTIVGFVLAEPDNVERFFHKMGALSLPYLGVTGTKRRRGIFGTLMQKQTAKGVALTATVLHTNRCGMADRLAKIGFKKVGHDAKQVKMRWEAPTP
jgi:predicted N-acetyltransferase YhbS